jgi:hypothetical protein
MSGRFLVGLVRRYLQPTVRVPGASVLIVEGWLKPHILRTAKIEFDRGGYGILLTASSDEPSADSSEDAAHDAAAYLRSLGIDSSRVIAVPAPRRTTHHSFAAAIAVRHWLLSAGRTGVGVNVFTGNTHGRKSWVVFRRALRGVAEVGIVSQPGWMSNEGRGPRTRTGRMRVLCKHGFGYLYALVWPVRL